MAHAHGSAGAIAAPVRGFHRARHLRRRRGDRRAGRARDDARADTHGVGDAPGGRTIRARAGGRNDEAIVDGTATSCDARSGPAYPSSLGTDSGATPHGRNLRSSPHGAVRDGAARYVLRAATSGAAELLGSGRRPGRRGREGRRPGRRRGDPLALADLPGRVRAVIQHGRLVSGAWPVATARIQRQPESSLPLDIPPYAYISCHAITYVVIPSPDVARPTACPTDAARRGIPRPPARRGRRRRPRSARRGHVHRCDRSDGRLGEARGGRRRSSPCQRPRRWPERRPPRHPHPRSRRMRTHVRRRRTTTSRQHGLANTSGAHAGDLPNLEVNSAGRPPRPSPTGSRSGRRRDAVRRERQRVHHPCERGRSADRCHERQQRRLGSPARSSRPWPPGPTDDAAR